ncbi:MAG: hypothetical protein LBQ20_09665 [Rhodanobacter sp.]|nr:hypothetical protein [Rhodanobacter sp.]
MRASPSRASGRFGSTPEVLVVDGGSRDDTPAIAHAMGARLSRPGLLGL